MARAMDHCRARRRDHLGHDGTPIFEHLGVSLEPLESFFALLKATTSG
jgi:hypothetical protein